MEQILVNVIIIITFLALSKVSSSMMYNNNNSIGKNGSTLLYNFENETETNETAAKAPTILHLYKCPGSSIANDITPNLSSDHFSLGYEKESLVIKLTEMQPECDNDSVFESKNFLKNETGEWQHSHSLYLHGWLLKFENSSVDEEKEEHVPPHRYCLDSLNDREFKVKYCRSNCSKEPCISKCCYADEVCDLGQSDRTCTCANSGALQWTISHSNLAANAKSDKPYAFVYHPFKCKSTEIEYFTLNTKSANLSANSRDELRLLDDGTAQIRHAVDGTWLSLKKGKYCVDGAQYLNNYYSGDSADMVLRNCRDTIGPSEPEKGEYILFRILLPFSIAFIILTITVYFLTWKEQGVHGYTVFSYLATLLGLYISLILDTIPNIAHPLNHPKFCKAIAGIIHFSYLSSMCWLTCVSFDVWRTFRKLNCPTYKSRGKRKFTLFFIFSVGYPSLKVSMCAMLDAMYKNYAEPPVVLPAYGTSVCSMSNSDGITFYLYIPVSVLLIFNTGFFLATIITMKQAKKSIRDAFNGISNNTSTKVDQSFGIYARLFIIMGIFWASQIVCWFAIPRDAYGRKSNSASLETLKAIVDALTVLQAVVIFYIFVCKRSVYVKLWNLQPCLQPCLSVCISGGCCTTPPENSRKFSQSQDSSRKGTLRSRQESYETAKNRFSTESNKTIGLNVRNNVASVSSEDSRKISVTSNETVISHVESGSKVVAIMDQRLSNLSAGEPAAETSL